MLSYEEAKTFYDEIRSKAGACEIEGFDEFYQRFQQTAMNYAQNRAAWAVMLQADRIADDKSRSIKHDAFIACLSGVCRTLELSKTMEELLPDRKMIGDFACYVALFLALEQR